MTCSLGTLMMVVMSCSCVWHEHISYMLALIRRVAELLHVELIFCACCATTNLKSNLHITVSIPPILAEVDMSGKVIMSGCSYNLTTRVRMCVPITTSSMSALLSMTISTHAPRSI